MDEDEAGNYRGAEDAGAKQLAHNDLRPATGSGRQRGEDVRASVAEGQQCDALVACCDDEMQALV